MLDVATPNPPDDEAIDVPDYFKVVNEDDLVGKKARTAVVKVSTCNFLQFTCNFP